VALPRWHGDSLYWLVEGTLLKTRDKGATWIKVSDLKDAQYGPVFGKTAAEMFVLTRGGVVFTTNGGAAWSKPLPVPDWKGGVAPLTWLDYDPVHDTLYLMKMGTDLFKLPNPRGI
jgi:hypothetical protein